MNMEFDMKGYISDLREQISELNSSLASMPEGRLVTCRDGDYYSWRVHKKGCAPVYLPKSQKETAMALALKELYSCRLHDLNIRLEAACRFNRYDERSVCKTDELAAKASPEFKRLLGDALSCGSAEAARWEAAEYERSAYYPENLIHDTLRGREKVRSKIEANAADALFTLKIPFRYEMMTMIGDRKIAVDLTALDVRIMREIPIEIFGMMDDLKYRNDQKWKLHQYIDAGYIPGVNMITIYEFSSSPLSLSSLLEIFTDFFIKTPPRCF